MKPSLKLQINRKDLNKAAKDRVLSINVDDYAGYISDVCTVSIDGRAPYPAIPKAGALLDVFMGYDVMKNSSAQIPPTLLGHYILNEMDWEGPPWTLHLHFVGLDMFNIADKTKQQQHEHYENTTVYDIVKACIGRMGFQADIHPVFQTIKVPYLAQDGISDMAFLNILAAKYGAFPKVSYAGTVSSGLNNGQTQNLGGGGIVQQVTGSFYRFYPKKGNNFVTTALFVKDCIPGTVKFHVNARAVYGLISAASFSYDTGALTYAEAQVTQGMGRFGNKPPADLPTMSLPIIYEDEEASRRAGKAKGEFLSQDCAAFSFECGGNPLMQTHRRLELTGSQWHPDIPKTWLITHVKHKWTKGDSEGYKTEVY
jgi:hypothetical protein